MYSVFYLQGRALYYACADGNLVRAQELLSMGTNVNYHHDDYVSYSTHIHTSGCVGYQYTVLIQPQ